MGIAAQLSVRDVNEMLTRCGNLIAALRSVRFIVDTAHCPGCNLSQTKLACNITPQNKPVPDTIFIRY